MNGNTITDTLPSGNSVNEQIGISMARKRYQLGSVKLRGKSWEFRWREDVIESGLIRRVTKRFAFAGAKDYGSMRAAIRDPWVQGKIAELNSVSYRPSTVITFAQFARRWEKEISSLMEPSTRSADRSRLGIKKAKKSTGPTSLETNGELQINAPKQDSSVPAQNPQITDLSDSVKLNVMLDGKRPRRLPTLLFLFGDILLKDIDARRVQLIVSSLREAGASGKTVKNYIATLRTLWKTARAWNHVTHDPFTGLVLPDASPREVPFYSDKQMQQIRNGSKEPYSTIWSLARQTGIRRSEVCALQVGDIAFYDEGENGELVAREQAVIVVRRKVWGNTVGPTKSKKPRIFSVSPELTIHLRAMTTGKSADALVFTNKKGTMLHPDNLVKRHLKPVVTALGLSGGMHAFRHGNATVLDRRGTPMAVRQGRLGHVNPKTTMGYTHLVTEDDLRASSMFDNMPAPERVM